MAYIYETPRFNEKLEGLDANTKKRVNKRIENMCNYPDLELLDILERNKFAPNLYVQKMMSDNLRIPVQTVEFQIKARKETVFFLLDILKKEEKVYKTLQDRTKKHDRQKYFKQMQISEALKKKIEKKLLKKEEEKGRLPELPDDLNRWLSIDRDWYDGSEEWIFESLNWVEKTQQRSFKEKEFPHIYNALVEYFINNKTKFLVENNEVLSKYPNVHLLHFDNTWILFETIYSEKEKKYYFLYDFVVNDQKIDLNDHIELMDKLYRRKLYDEFSGYALRTYPSYILVDMDIWKEIEKNERTNLALSSEELHALYKVKLPVFINGQAGSGKSTILYYLFADYLFEKFKNKLPGRPIFLTFSKALIDDAKRNIETIFKSYSKYVDKENILSIIGGNFSEYFYRYSDLLIKILQDFNQISKNFDTKELIDFNKFRTLYHGGNLEETNKSFPCNLAESKKYSPEIAWHVIRTYIKGYKTDGYLTPEEYRYIPDEDQTVSYETYNEIFNSIWSKWYKKFSNELKVYDQQDLTRKVLKLIKITKKAYVLERFPAIFCDEAQDFTRIELDFILRITSFYGYDLSSIDEIPLAFAGDPFQTINPTGFRWEFLKSTFYTKFKELNFPVRISEINLTVNFRSNSRIVEFANLVQFFRQMWIDSSLLKKVKPQESGVKVFDEAPPLKFIHNEDLTQEELKEVIKRGNVVIIPAEYDGEEEYVESHQEYFPKGDHLNNVFSPLKVKGMEYAKIIILNFGAKYGHLFNDIHNRELSKNEEIELEYVLNKIYVSITRARRNLYIIDSKEGIEHLWDLFNEEWYEKYYANVDDTNVEETWSKDVITFLSKGTRANIKELMDADLGEIAEELKNAGIAQEDTELLKRAAHYYHRNSEQSRQLECLAMAYELDGQFKEAGDKWRHSLVDKPDKALACYWKGMCWDRISEFYENNKLKHAIAEFMLNEDYNLLIPQLLKMFQANMLQKIKTLDKTWIKVINTLQSRLEKNINTITQNEFYKLISYVEGLGQRGFPKFYELIAKFLFSLKNYQGAISYWDKSNPNMDTPQYFEAKFNITDDIDNKIKYAEKSSLMFKEREILKIWQTNKNFSYSDESIRAIKKAYKKAKKPTDEEYIKFLIENFNSLDDVREIINLYENLQKSDAQLEIELINYLFTNSEWYRLIPLLKKNEFIKRNIELIIENTLDETNIESEKAELVMDYLADLHSENIPIIPTKLIKYIYQNQIYLIPFRSKVNKFIKDKLLEQHLQYILINENEKYLEFKKSFYANDWMYVLAACIINNDEFFFIDRIHIINKILDYSLGRHHKEMNEWAKKVWLFLQSGYIKRRKNDITKGERKGRNERKLKEIISTINKEKERLEDKIKEWHMDIPNSIPACPFNAYQLLVEHPFKVYPEEAEIDVQSKFTKLNFIGYQIKCFTEEGRVIINNDDEDIQIKILTKTQDVSSMTKGFNTRKNKNGFLDFNIMNKPVKGSVGKKGLVEIYIENEKIKIQL